MGGDEPRVQVQCLRLIGETALRDVVVRIKPEPNPGQIESLRILYEPVRDQGLCWIWLIVIYQTSVSPPGSVSVLKLCST